MKIIMLIPLLLIVVTGTGWVKNLIKLSSCDFESPYKAEVIHTAGLLPPIGAVTGWLDLGK